jgi:hypothetical protein
MKVICNPENQSIIEPIVFGKSNANDIIGLDPSFLILEKVFVSTPTYDPQVENAIESWTIDSDNLQYVQTWTIVELIPAPDWTGFNLAIFSDPAFASWQISPILQSAIVAQATSRNLEVLQTCYNLAKAQIAPSPETIATWQSIADQYHIGLIL